MTIKIQLVGHVVELKYYRVEIFLTVYEVYKKCLIQRCCLIYVFYKKKILTMGDEQKKNHDVM